MTLHFTYEGGSAEVGGRVFRFSKELGRRVGASADGMLLLPRRGVVGSLQLTVKEATDVK